MTTWVSEREWLSEDDRFYASISWRAEGGGRVYRGHAVRESVMIVKTRECASFEEAREALLEELDSFAQEIVDFSVEIEED